MKSKYIRYFVLGLLILTAAVSCKSTQPATEAPPPDEALDPNDGPPDQAALNDLNAAVDKAVIARQLVIDFNGPAYFPPDWNAAESLYSQAESGKSTANLRSTRDSTARYNAAAGAYRALADKTIPQYAQDLESDVVGIRDKALAAGANYLAQDYLYEADNKAVEAYTAYQSNDYYNARDTAFAARDMYEALATGVNAYKVRLEIEDRGFVRYDPSAIETADSVGLSAIDDYDAGNIASARSKAEDALSQYNKSLAKGKESYASDTGAAAAAERQRSLDLKANVAVRQDYDAANAVYNRAVTSFRGRNYDDAGNLYNQSRILFEAVTTSAREKRRIAEEALREAELKMVESDGTARNAEIILEGGAQ
ncbi:hypothetical protein [Leadbettera azotonutricia]|uniref:Putative lipoprotein n=1 Tax=Leadbettera azotonutricia (strain ATCC BAA-888 / DSM 13862 / ZAS-9) TaxID=545695 RepID=F5YEQ5_LEAAZ|nr:hypothetical protein [Leadbettera azotonutricia]AEF80226.1 putative lipoprotein [Leadbettera azotonutricia ZAS-9]